MNPTTEAERSPMVDVREGDVFRFSYSEAERKRRFEPSHCFDGQLVAFKRAAGIRLVDTYWLHGLQDRHDSTCFTPDEAERFGTLTYVCNLNEVYNASESETNYFDDADVFNLSYQHQCYKNFVIRIGAARSPEKMMLVIEQRIADATREISSAVRSIQRLNEFAEKVKSGNLTEVYL